jgi:IS5 family transposase
MHAISGWASSGGGGGVIERRYRQRNLFEAVLGSVEELVEGLIEPPLRRLDEVLADEALLDAVMQELARRHPHSRSRGRRGTPGEVALRMLVLKRIKGWSFEETEHEVRKNLVYRHLARVYFERVPDAKNLDSAFSRDWCRRRRSNPPAAGGNGAGSKA